MRRLAFPLAFVLLAALTASPSPGAVAAAAAPPAGPVPAAAQAFGAELDIGYCYDYLAPYGTWLSLDPYGYVWCPRHMGYGWRPYADGRWFWSDYGWCWASDLDWGWMPFHYGRWGWDDDCGWFWVPDTVWGPAWVFWRFGDPYLGWAPIPPGVEFGAGIDFDAVAIGLPLNFWVFINGSHFLDRDVRSYSLPHERNASIVRMTEFRNRFDFRGGRMIDQGIDPETIRRVTGRPVRRYVLADADRPGSPRIAGNEARVYRPEFRANPQARPKQFMPREKARQEMGAARIYESPRQAPSRAPESTVRKRQAQERGLLERSQAEERRVTAQRQAQERRRVQNPDERAKIEQQHRAQAAEQQKQHQAERQQMAERHQREAEQVRRAAPQRTQPSNPRKK